MTVKCARCQQEKPGLDAPPYPGELGEEILARVCSDCWNEWQAAEIIVINEFRLNFMDPRANEILVRHLREFLILDQPATTGE